MAPDMFIHIEDYLDDALPPAERAAFEEELRRDPELAQMVALVRQARKHLVRQWAGEPTEAALVDTLRHIGKDYFQGAAAVPAAKVRAVFFQRLALAAAAVLALLVAAWLFFLRPPQHERLYARYKALPEASFAVRSAEGAGLSDEAAQAFNRRRYKEALAALEEHLRRDPEDAEARYFAGLCLLELRRFSEARAAFEQIARVPAWTDEARWYTALSYLREGNFSECRRLLEQLPPESVRYGQARQLLEALKP